MLASAQPSAAILEADDDQQLSAELRLARLHAQAAVVRALADNIASCAQAEDADGLSEQLVEETVRLRAFEAAVPTVR